MKAKKHSKPFNFWLPNALKIDSGKVRRIQSAHAMRRSKERSLNKNKDQKSVKM